MYPTQNVLFSFRLQIGWVSLPEHLLRIVFNLLCTVGDPLHHYLMSIDDRMIGFLQGISMVLLVKCYWKYPGKIVYFFPETLLTFQRLESFGVSRKAEYLSIGGPHFTTRLIEQSSEVVTHRWYSHECPRLPTPCPDVQETMVCISILPSLTAPNSSDFLYWSPSQPSSESASHEEISEELFCLCPWNTPRCAKWVCESPSGQGSSSSHVLPLSFLCQSQTPVVQDTMQEMSTTAQAFQSVHRAEDHQAAGDVHKPAKLHILHISTSQTLVQSLMISETTQKDLLCSSDGVSRA
ncbi:uncharacterized protein GJ701_003928 [Geothlypis trichas]